MNRLDLLVAGQVADEVGKLRYVERLAVLEAKAAVLFKRVEEWAFDPANIDRVRGVIFVERRFDTRECDLDEVGRPSVESFGYGKESMYTLRISDAHAREGEGETLRVYHHTSWHCWSGHLRRGDPSSRCRGVARYRLKKGRARSCAKPSGDRGLRGLHAIAFYSWLLGEEVVADFSVNEVEAGVQLARIPAEFRGGVLLNLRERFGL